jgi:hypothetical protein
MKEMKRRKFIGSLAAALAAGMAGTVIESCTSIRGGYLNGKTGSNGQLHALDRLNRNCRSLRRNKIFKQAAYLYQNGGCNTELLPDILETLLVTGFFADMNENDRHHSEVQQRVHNANPVMNDAFLGIATYMEGLEPEQRIELHRALIEHPEILSEFQVQFDIASRDNDVPLERIKHFHSLFNQCCWRLKYQDPSALIDECVTMVDKEALREGITPQQRRNLMAAGGLQKQGSGPDDFDYSRFQNQYAALENSNDSTIATDAIEKGQLRRSKGRRMIGIGAGLMGLGIIGIDAGIRVVNNNGRDRVMVNGAIFFGCIGGAICLIIGLILIITGANKVYKAKKLLNPQEKQ